jgi:hypothetical protein
MSCILHGWIKDTPCPDCTAEAVDLERHRVIFTELTAIALWVGQEPVWKVNEKFLDDTAKDCWLEAARLWKARVL